MSEYTKVKKSYSISQAWHDLDLPGKPAKICRSPFPIEHKNGDLHPSFSVYDEGQRWKNYATGEGGDVIDLVCKAVKIDKAEAVSWMCERINSPNPSKRFGSIKRSPKLLQGSDKEILQLGEQRNLSIEALKLATERKFLFFTELFSQQAWAVTDNRRQIIEYRRLDNKLWAACGSLSNRKSHCRGSGKDWPIGVEESLPYPKIAFVEGAPDFLAVFQFILAESKEETVAPCAMLGSANHRINPEALNYFKGKHVCIYPHLDDAGYNAAKAWASQLQETGAYVEAFNLSGCTKIDGSIGKDLNDINLIDADCFEEERKFWEVLP